MSTSSSYEGLVCLSRKGTQSCWGEVIFVLAAKNMCSWELEAFSSNTCPSLEGLRSDLMAGSLSLTTEVEEREACLLAKPLSRFEATLALNFGTPLAVRDGRVGGCGTSTISKFGRVAAAP